MRVSKSADQQIASWELVFVGCALAIVGYFGPWIGHKTAALTVTGFELSWFAKFLPQVDSGIVPVKREQFFIPLVAAAVLLGLWINQQFVRRSFILRLSLTALTVLLVLFALPPYDFFFTPEYRRQLIVTAIGAVLVPLTVLAHWLPQRAWGALFAASALVGGGLALRQFLLLRPLVVALYGKPFSLGWGVIACVIGFALLLVQGVLAVANPKHAMRPAP